MISPASIVAQTAQIRNKTETTSLVVVLAMSRLRRNWSGLSSLFLHCRFFHSCPRSRTARRTAVSRFLKAISATRSANGDRFISSLTPLNPSRPTAKIRQRLLRLAHGVKQHAWGNAARGLLPVGSLRLTKHRPPVLDGARNEPAERRTARNSETTEKSDQRTKTKTESCPRQSARSAAALRRKNIVFPQLFDHRLANEFACPVAKEKLGNFEEFYWSRFARMESDCVELNYQVCAALKQFFPRLRQFYIRPAKRIEQPHFMFGGP